MYSCPSVAECTSHLPPVSLTQFPLEALFVLAELAKILAELFTLPPTVETSPLAANAANFTSRFGGFASRLGSFAPRVGPRLAGFRLSFQTVAAGIRARLAGLSVVPVIPSGLRKSGGDQEKSSEGELHDRSFQDVILPG